MRPLRRLLAAALLTAVLVPPGFAARGDRAKRGADEAQTVVRAEGQDQLDEWADQVGRIELSETVYRMEGRSFRDGVCEWTFDAGVAVPLVSGEPPETDRIVGFVFMGEGTVSVDFPDRADAWDYANHQSIIGGRDPASVADIAHRKAPLKVAIKRGFIAGADPAVKAILNGLEPVGSGMVLQDVTGELTETATDGAWTEAAGEYLVTARRGKLRARIVSETLFPERRAELRNGGIDIIQALRVDRLLNERAGLAGEKTRVFGEFLTDERFHVVLKDDKVAVDDADRWLSCYRDGGGLGDLGQYQTVFSHGTNEQTYHRKQISGAGWIPGQSSHSLDGAPKPALLPSSADNEIKIRSRKIGKVMEATISSTMRFRAERRTQHLLVSLPAGEAYDDAFQINFLGLDDGTPLPYLPLTSGTFDNRLGPAALDGSDGLVSGIQTTDIDADDNSSLSGMGDEQGSTATPPSGAAAENVPERRTRFELLVPLPEPLRAGQEVGIQLDWSTDWLLAQWVQANGQFLSAGPTTGFRNFMPEVLPAYGATRWTHTTKVKLPPRRVQAALSGETRLEWVDNDDLSPWIESRGKDERNPGIALGNYVHSEEPGQLGLPTIRTNVFIGEAYALEELPPQVRAVWTFYRRLLPDLPSREVDIFQGADAADFGARNVGGGLLEINQVSRIEGVGNQEDFAKLDPHAAQSMVARNVARLWWGDLVTPANSRQAWLAGVMSDCYSAFFQRGVYGTDDFFEYMENIRKVLENRKDQVQFLGVEDDRKPFPSLTRESTVQNYSPRLRSFYGLYVLGGMARYRVGHDAYFSAMDGLVNRRAGDVYTIDHIQEALEQSSGIELDDFFDYWVHGGFIPEIRVDWWMSDGGVSGCITTDIPFGIMRMPVRVQDREGERMVEALVRVEDGFGAFEVPGREGSVEVFADPDGLILAYGRKVKEHKTTQTCE